MTPEAKAAMVSRMRTEWPSGTLRKIEGLCLWVSLADAEEFEYQLFELLEEAYLAGRDDMETDVAAFHGRVEL